MQVSIIMYNINTNHLGVNFILHENPSGEGECLNLENNLQWWFDNSCLLYNYLIYTYLFFLFFTEPRTQFVRHACGILGRYFGHSLRISTILSAWIQFKVDNMINNVIKILGVAGAVLWWKGTSFIFPGVSIRTKIVGLQKLPTSGIPRHPFAILEFKDITLNQIIYYIKSIFFWILNEPSLTTFQTQFCLSYWALYTYSLSTRRIRVYRRTQSYNRVWKDVFWWVVGTGMS